MDYIDKSYILRLSSYLSKFKDAGNNVYNFRCPICNDSAKDRTKTRGYLYEKSNKILYHCHNCGSPDHRSLSKLMNFVAPALYKEYRLEKFKESNNIYKEEPKIINHDKFKVDTSRITKVKVSNQHPLQLCSRIKPNSDAHKYLIDRHIHETDGLYYIDDINKITSTFNKYKEKKFYKSDAIVIPLVKDGVLNGVQLRLLNSTMRYLILSNNEDVLLWGYDDVDATQTVYVFEGAFDAMLCPNGMSIQGASHMSKYGLLKEKFKDFVFVYDADYKMNVEIKASINKAIESNISVVVYGEEFDGIKIKDLNDAVKEYNWNKDDVKQYLKSHTYKGLKAKLHLSK